MVVILVMIFTFNIFRTKQEYVGNNGDFFLFLTNVGAPMYHVIEIDIRNKKPRNNVDVVVAVSNFKQLSPFVN